jgi:hypothetical protein
MISGPPACGRLRAAAELVLATGGLELKRLRSSALTVRIGLDGCADALRVQHRISALAGDLLQMAVDASESEGTPPCCIPRVRVHDHRAARVDMDLQVERSDARGQAFLETAARSVVPLLERLAECKTAATLQIFSTPVDHINVNGRVEVEELLGAVLRAAGVPDASAEVRTSVDERVRCFCSGSHQPELAARHNEHVLAAVSAAFGRELDMDRFVREVRAHAARWGSCEPLVNWRQRDRELIGELLLPLMFDEQDAADRSAKRHTPNTIGARALREHLPSDPLVDLAGIALAASLGFLQEGLLAELPRRRRTLLPPPLPAHLRPHRPPAGDDAEKRRYESGVRPAVRDTDLLRARTGSDHY